MRKNMGALTLLLTVFELSGCQHANIKDDLAYRRPTSVEYYLPNVRYEIKAVYKLEECKAAIYIQDTHESLFKDFDYKAKYALIGAPRIKTSYTLLQKYGADYSEGFSLDAESLSTGRLEQNVAIGLYENGTLKSINSSVIDQSGAAITGILKFVTNLAGIGNIFKAPASAPFTKALSKEKPSQELCNEDIRSALAEASTIREQVDTLKQEQRVMALDKANPEKSKAYLDSIDKKISALIARLDYLQNDKLTIERTYSQELDDVRHSYKFNPPLEVFTGKWFAERASSVLASDAFLSGELYFSKIPTQITTTTDAKKADLENNLVIRRPFDTHLKLCHLTCDDDNKNNVVYEGLSRVPQWGAVEVIDFNAHVFENRTITLQFAADGRVEQFTYNKRATIANATGALSDTSSALKALAEARSIGDDAVEIDYLDKEIKKIKLRRELEELRKPTSAE